MGYYLLPMEFINSQLDWLYFTVLVPLFTWGAHLLTLLLITPFINLKVPLLPHVAGLGTLLAILALGLRNLLQVEQKVAAFNTSFDAQRSRQQDLQLISDKRSRDALYRATDEDLNSSYNTFLAQHYARYVLIYLLPLFLSLAWLNSVFSQEYLYERLGQGSLVTLPPNGYGAQGLSVTFVFLVSYVLSLVIGFRVRRLFRCRAAKLK